MKLKAIQFLIMQLGPADVHQLKSWLHDYHVQPARPTPPLIDRPIGEDTISEPTPPDETMMLVIAAGDTILRYTDYLVDRQMNTFGPFIPGVPTCEDCGPESFSDLYLVNGIMLCRDCIHAEYAPAPVLTLADFVHQKKEVRLAVLRQKFSDCDKELDHLVSSKQVQIQISAGSNEAYVQCIATSMGGATA